jgi:hypothetical protein
MEHALHLAAKHFIQKAAPNLASDPSIPTNLDSDSDSDSDRDQVLDPGDSLGKALALVKQVSARCTSDLSSR